MREQLKRANSRELAMETKMHHVENNMSSMLSSATSSWTKQGDIEAAKAVERTALREAQRLGEENARLVGHQNKKQRIHIVARMRNENLDLKKEKVKLRTVV